MAHYLNDGTQDAPKLRVYLNTDNLTALPEHSIWPGLTGEAALRRLARDGFEGVQLGESDAIIASSESLPFCGLDRINTPEEAQPIFARHAARGNECLTLHLGWGMEDDDAVDRLLEAVLTASDKHRLPAVHLHHRLMQILERAGHPFPAWFRDFTGFLSAVSPLGYLAFKTTRHLNQCYPDSPARKILEPRSVRRRIGGSFIRKRTSNTQH